MKLLALSTILFAATAFAEGKPDLAQMKENILKHTDAKITVLQAHRTCVSAAATVPELKECTKKMEAQRNELKAKADAMRAEFKKNRKEKKK